VVDELNDSPAHVRSAHIAERWSAPLLEGGFTAVPTFVLRNLWRLEHRPTPTEVLCLIHLASYRRRSEAVFLSTKVLAGALGMNPSGLRKVLRSLERKRLLRTELHRGGQTLYDIEPFILKMTTIAMELELRRREAVEPRVNTA
jgi:hypothetical protein